MKTCPICGIKCPDTARFCSECGHRFEDQPKPAPQPAPQAAREPAPQPAAAPKYPADPSTVAQGSFGTALNKDDDWGTDSSSSQVDPNSGFSETSWFRAAVKPEDLPEKADAEDLEGRYQRDPNLSEEERRKYSLNRDKSGKGDKN